MDIEKNVHSVMARVAAAARAAGRAPEEINLVAATKMNDCGRIAQAIGAGIKICGENRVQELTEKDAQNAYAGAQKHFIGHLQKNKVNKVVGVCDLIQSVDSLQLLEAINRRAESLGTVQDLLLEVNIAGEESKSGLSPAELPELLKTVQTLGFVHVRGLMAIPPVSSESGANRIYFRQMKQLFIDISTKKYDNVSMDFLSMGMSGDFEDAIAVGSNMVRVGSAIFGVRIYT